jgi:Phasin protein
MAKDRETYGLNVAAQIPNAGVLLEAQRAAAENAAKIAGATCHYAMSWNRAWLNFWSNHLSQYTELPRRFADVQTDFMEQAFDHYQRSIQELGVLASQMQHEAEDTIRATQDLGKQAAQELRPEATKDISKGMAKEGRPKEAHPGEDQRGRQRGAH